LIKKNHRSRRLSAERGPKSCCGSTAGVQISQFVVLFSFFREEPQFVHIGISWHITTVAWSMAEEPNDALDIWYTCIMYQSSCSRQRVTKDREAPFQILLVLLMGRGGRLSRWQMLPENTQ